jgi:hypothetical protein
MFKKFLELMAGKFFKKRMTTSEYYELRRKKFMDEHKARAARKEKEHRELIDRAKKFTKETKEWEARVTGKLKDLGDRLESGSKPTNKELGELFGQDPKEFVQENLDRARRQRKSVKKYRADVDKGAGKWSPSRGIAPWKKTTSGKHLLNTPAASLVGAGTAASLTRKKKREK